MEEKQEIVIIGGGICGLATALALHRKGVKSVVLERSETLRAHGGGIGLLPNAWRALDQLGVGSHLRTMAIPLTQGRDILLDENKERKIEHVIGETRCLQRSDLITALADELPDETIRFGCEAISVDLHPITNKPRLLLTNGTYIVVEILIGCEGGRSIVADYLGLKPAKTFGVGVMRGLTTFPNGHSMPHEFLRMRKGDIGVGILPITQNLIHWFVALPTHLLSGKNFPHDPKQIQQMALESVANFPSTVHEIIEQTDQDSVSAAHLRYRAPWDLLLGTLRKGHVTVAGDAMHVMGPFVGQGGGSGLEDAIVLVKCLSSALNNNKSNYNKERIGVALDEYIKERRMRVFKLSLQTYLIGMLMGSTSQLLKMVFGITMALLFRDRASHVNYDCGDL